MRNRIVPFVRPRTEVDLLWATAQAAEEDANSLGAAISSLKYVKAGHLAGLYHAQIDYIRHRADAVFYYLDNK